jgi:uncharacterized protein involved in response to NO
LPDTPAFPTILRAAPHRALFLAGTAQAVLSMAWWLGVLLARGHGEVLAAPLPDAAMHAWLLMQGMFPFFVFGFLFTALPNWVEAPGIAPRAFLSCAAMLLAGTLLAQCAQFVDARLALLGLVARLVAWGIGLAALAGALRRARQADLRQPWIAWSATLAGAFGDAAYLAGLASGDATWFGVGASVGIWGFLVPLFLAVCHRMIPFFTSRVVANYVIVRPYRPLWLMLAASLGHGALELAGASAWTWLADIPLALLGIGLARRWGIARALRERLLAMLHLGFLWCPLAGALYAVDSLARCLGLGWHLGLAPPHALGIGFFASLLLAMATRVSLGHSGRPLQADGLVWGLFWLLQGAALARLAADLLPGAPRDAILSVAALLWLLVFAVWGWRHAPLYWRRRADGRPG